MVVGVVPVVVVTDDPEVILSCGFHMLQCELWLVVMSLKLIE